MVPPLLWGSGVLLVRHVVPSAVEGELSRRRRAHSRRWARVAIAGAVVEGALAFLGGRASAAVSTSEHASAPPASSSSRPAVVRWRLGAFARCVRARESSNGRTTRNLYGMLDGWTVAGG